MTAGVKGGRTFMGDDGHERVMGMKAPLAKANRFLHALDQRLQRVLRYHSDALDEVGECWLQHQSHKIVLGADVVVPASLEHARVSRDVLHRFSGVAVRTEYARGDREKFSQAPGVSAGISFVACHRYRVQVPGGAAASRVAVWLHHRASAAN